MGFIFLYIFLSLTLIAITSGPRCSSSLARIDQSLNLVYMVAGVGEGWSPVWAASGEAGGLPELSRVGGATASQRGPLKPIARQGWGIFCGAARLIIQERRRRRRWREKARC